MLSIKDRYQFFIEYFKNEMPIAESELIYKNPFQLLVAVILSAQCTDKRVNMVTPKLFEKYPTPEALSNSTQEEVYIIIRSVTYPNNKSKNLVSMAKKLVEKFNSV
ncbi:MAG: endonuclease III, partial [Bacteroidales bacterium]